MEPLKRIPFTREAILAILREQEPKVAALAKKIREAAHSADAKLKNFLLD